MLSGRDADDKRDYSDATKYPVDQIEAKWIRVLRDVSAFNADNSTVKLDDDE